MRSVLLALALLLLLVPPAGASAGAPREFFGVMADGPLIEPIGLDVAAEARAMRRAGVGSVRLVLYWDAIEPLPGARRWGSYDALVAELARRGIRVLPVLYRAPAWARTGDTADAASPPRLRPWAAFVRAAVRRYGTRGSFWRTQRGLPRRPMRQWQVWNEPNLDKYWLGTPWPATYARLLRTTYRTIKRADRSAKVVTAGLSGDLDELVHDLYDARAGGAFDAIGLNVYRHRPGLVFVALQSARRAIAARGARVPIVVSEVSFSSGLGWSTYDLGIERDEAGQRAALEELLQVLVEQRRRLGLSGVYWYTWLSWPPGRPVSFEYSGLRRLTDDGTVVSKPALAGFRRIAR